MSEPARRVRLLLIDDHALFREGLVRLFAAEPDLEVVAHAPSVSEGLKALASAPMDVVLLDVDLGNERGLDFLTRARKDGFTGPILVVTAGVDTSEAAQLIAHGAAGIFLKQDSAQLLAQGIRTVADGRAWIDQRHLTSVIASQHGPGTADRTRLTTREREVLRGVFDGLANKEIAARLQLSESSVKGILQQLFSKTGVRTRSQLVRIALERYAREL